MNSTNAQPTQVTKAIESVRPSVQQLTAPQLRRATKAAYKLYAGLLKDLTTEDRKRLTPLYDHLLETWLMFYREEERRRLLTAERKDRGEVLYEIFFPRQYSWERQKVITRTPHRQINHRSYSADADINVVRPEDWLADFRKAQVAA